MKNPLIEQVENEAIEVFGADKIGTKELREKLSRLEKENLLRWLANRYLQLKILYSFVQ